jgi:glutathione S-transferase
MSAPDVAKEVGLEDKAAAAPTEGRRASKQEGASGEAAAQAPIGLHIARLSANCAGAWVICKHCEIPYAITDVDIMVGGARTPEHMALNPFGHVPALKNGDFGMGEGSSMMRYVCRKNAAKTEALYPADVEKRSLIDSALDWRLQELYPAIKDVAYPVFGWPGHHGDDKAAAKASLDASLAVLESITDDKFAMKQDGVSIADIAIVTSLTFLEGCGDAGKLSDKVAAYVARVKAACPAIDDVQTNADGGFSTRAYFGTLKKAE